MKLRIPLIVMGLLALSPTAFSADLYLEGISVLGAKKKAMLTLDGQNLTVAPGDTVGEWTVENIEQRSIFLRKKTPEGQPQGELKELELHSRLTEDAPPIPTPTILIGPNTPPFGNPNGLPPPPPAEPFKPHRIAPADVPPGHHVVNTPFGDVLVKDQPSESPPAQ